jgi:hypothetical protein
MRGGMTAGMALGAWMAIGCESGQPVETGVALPVVRSAASSTEQPQEPQRAETPPASAEDAAPVADPDRPALVDPDDRTDTPATEPDTGVATAVCAADLAPAEFSFPDDALACDGPQFVRYVEEQELWVGIVGCGDGAVRFYLAAAPEGPFLPALDVAGHGQDACELIRPGFFLPEGDDITSGGCADCSIGMNLPLEGVAGYSRAASGERYTFVAETGPWSYQVGRVNCGCSAGEAGSAASGSGGDADDGEQDPPPAETPREDDDAPDAPATAGESPRLLELVVPATVQAGGTLEVVWRVTSAAGLGLLDDGPATWMFVGGPSGWVTWCDFPTAAARVSGDERDGVYRATCAVPETTPDGTYHVEVHAYDVAGARSPDDGLSATTRVVGGSADAAVPELLSIEVVTPVVGPGDEVVVRVTARDESGVAFLMPWVLGPNGLFAAPAGGLWADGPLAELVSGDAREGVWEARLTLIDAAEPGVYALSVSVGDVVGNRTHEWLGELAPRFEVEAR